MNSYKSPKYIKIYPNSLISSYVYVIFPKYQSLFKRDYYTYLYKWRDNKKYEVYLCKYKISKKPEIKRKIISQIDDGGIIVRYK